MNENKADAPWMKQEKSVYGNIEMGEIIFRWEVGRRASV